MLVLFVGALVDIIMRDQSLVRHLPKLVWILIVILLPTVGSILWFAVGREYPRLAERPHSGEQRRNNGNSNAGHSNIGHGSGGDAMLPMSMPGVYGERNTAAELAALDREIAAHEKADHIRRLEAELRARRGVEGPSN
ncbi:MAG: PLD nuclease N-terminal domain-containing protein [Gaiellales bacterium]